LVLSVVDNPELVVRVDTVVVGPAVVVLSVDSADGKGIGDGVVVVSLPIDEWFNGIGDGVGLRSFPMFDPPAVFPPVDALASFGASVVVVIDVVKLLGDTVCNRRGGAVVLGDDYRLYRQVTSQHR
jgi:hypothetical protein